ncbi:ADP-ribosylglycohydrolase family protein [Candidatus Saccharibacteria bacterium]|nr:ADP-ribosylglycohydrolase family protein [Candidatus Saccharibacteria bacterium]
MNIYFDIDGVLKGVASPVEDLVELVTYVLDNFPGHVYWLTTHCKGGANNAIYALQDVFDEKLLDRMAKEIQPTDWGTLKTDAIDFDQPFLWLDDDLWQSELLVLKEHGAVNSHVMMDWKDEWAAKKALARIKKKQNVHESGSEDMLNRARGMLVGLAVGDALGVPIEFGFTAQDIEANIENVMKMLKYRGMRGVWSDDTSMALCLGDSLVENAGYDSYDVMTKYLLWRNQGYNSLAGPAFGIGLQTNDVISKFEDSPVVGKDTEKEERAGNGGIMRLAPAIIARKDADIEDAIELGRISARETHNSLMVEMTAEIFSAALYMALHGEDKEKILAECDNYLSDDLRESYDKEKANIFDRVADDGENLKDLGGYTVDALTIALWGLKNADSFEEGMQKVLCLSGDADTNGAIYGQLAGAYFGYKNIPQNWPETIQKQPEIKDLADRLFEMKECPIIATRFEEDEEKGYFE